MPVSQKREKGNLQRNLRTAEVLIRCLQAVV
jgi:hypothetical protein